MNFYLFILNVAEQMIKLERSGKENKIDRKWGVEETAESIILSCVCVNVSKLSIDLKYSIEFFFLLFQEALNIHIFFVQNGIARLFFSSSFAADK